MEQPHLPGEQLLLQLLGQRTQEGPKQGRTTACVKKMDCTIKIANYCYFKKIYIFLLHCQGKIGNKPDETWIMNRLIKQLTDMGFPVCGTNLYTFPAFAL